MNKQEIGRVVKETVNHVIDVQKHLTENEKIACIAIAAAGIATATAIHVSAKLSAMKRRVKRCEKRLYELENMYTDPIN